MKCKHALVFLKHEAQNSCFTVMPGPSQDTNKILTAGDVYVCTDCEDFADGGPYTSGEVIGLIPRHVNCPL